MGCWENIFFNTDTSCILRTSVYYKTFSYRRGTKNLSRVRVISCLEMGSNCLLLAKIWLVAF